MHGAEPQGRLQGSDSVSHRFPLFALLIPFLAGCPTDPDTPDGPCPVTADPYVEFAQRDADYATFSGGDTLEYGDPPQGGAPFAPFLVRAYGLDHSADGYKVFLDAIDTETDEILGQGEYPQLFVCANVGDNAGYRIAPELHMRFFGFDLADLQGRSAEIVVRLEGGAGELLESGFTATLSEDGP